MLYLWARLVGTYVFTVTDTMALHFHIECIVSRSVCRMHPRLRFACVTYEASKSPSLVVAHRSSPTLPGTAGKPLSFLLKKCNSII